MELNKYIWNNGTQSSPIVLTKDQIKKLIAIGQREDIETNVSGWITTSSRKMQKFLKYTLEQQFPNLNIVCDEELPDIFTINTSSNIIEEGNKEVISIITDSDITHEFLQWKYDYSDFVIDGDISEQNIKDRIRVENGQLIINDPQENASWSVKLTLTAYPIYYNSEDFDTIPVTSKPNIIFTIYAKKIEDISISVDSEIKINSSINVNVTPIPIDSTKLKGVNYTYTTTTPDILFINISSSKTEIITKKAGTANLTVTLNAFNNTFNRTKSITFDVYDLRPIRFIIDQRYNNNLSDPDAMVSANYILNSDGTLQFVSNNGAEGNYNSNVITWLKKNTHAYVSKAVTSTNIRLKQLDDNNRKLFADGSSSEDYISNTSNEYDVFLKFGSDIYYKTEPYTPEGESSPNEDYILVSIAKELPENEDETFWHKWSKYKLISVYKACYRNNKLYSLSGKKQSNSISNLECIERAKARGNNFNILDYESHILFVLLFYGYYGSLNSQQICGYGTYNFFDGRYNPKLTGLTDELGMTDTTSITGNGNSSPNNEQIVAGYGDNIKSINFWGLENYWGDIFECISNIHIMEAFRSNTNTTVNDKKYVSDYLDAYNSIIITKQDGTDVTYTSKEKFLIDYTNSKHKFVAVGDKNNTIVRIIDLEITTNTNGYIKKMIFGKHADIIPKNFINKASENTGFCDYCNILGANSVAMKGFQSNNPFGGISSIVLQNGDHDRGTFTTRLLYNGDENTVHIIDDATETL